MGFLGRILAALLLGLASCADSEAHAAARNTVVFTGEVERGQLFARGFGERFAFLLRPGKHGWWITIHDERGTRDLSVYTPPWHTPNPRDVVGWHFRNSDNTGPNECGEKNVNAPQEERPFIFSPEVGRTIPSASKPSHEEMDRIRAFGRGLLTIEDYRITEIYPGYRASFEWLSFRVELSWPADDASR